MVTHSGLSEVNEAIDYSTPDLGGGVHIYLLLAGVSSSTMINKSQADMCEAETIPEKSSKAAGRINVSSQDTPCSVSFHY